MIKLNLGCGQDIREGYLNVDMNPIKGATQADLSTLPWVWEDSSVDEVLMLDFLEHFPYRKTESILFEVWRILKPGGFVDIQVPSFEECSKALNQDLGFLCNRCGFQFTEEFVLRLMYDWKCGQCGQHVDDISEAAMMRLYGGQDYEGNWHYTTFTSRSLATKLAKVGFFKLEPLEIEHQRKNWNFKVRAQKTGDVWGDDG